MSTWNRSYLEAIGLPVWVSRQAAVSITVSEKIEVKAEADVEPKTEAQEKVKEKVQTKAEVQTTAASNLGFISVAVNPQAKAYILITLEQDLKQAQSNFQLLKQAWKQWQNTELPLALVQLVEQGDSTLKSEPINELKDKQLLLSSNQTVNLPHLTVESAPALNWQSASDKKAWWQLLQTFSE